MIGLARSQSFRAGRVCPRAPGHAFLRPQPLQNALRTQLICTAHGKTWWWPIKRVVATNGQIGGSRQGSTWDPKAQIISSLNPANFRAMKQGVMDVSEMAACPLTVHGREDALQRGILYISYTRAGKEKRRFPAGTRGVFYFHHAGGQLRFRLCHSLEEFPNGSDLLLPDGQIWARSLQHMAQTRRTYASLLALLSEEFPISPAQVDPSIDSQRRVIALSPRDLVFKGQQVFDISGIQCARFATSYRREDQYDCVPVPFHQAGKEHIPFPPDTVGLLYYKQSLAYPTEIGELRFRLCSDPSLFDQGSDLASPSGNPWFFSSHELHKNITLRPLANMLYQDGLLKRPDPSLVHTLRTAECPNTPILTRLSQPFVLNLSQHLPLLTLLVDPSPQPVAFRIRIWDQRLFRRRFYQGRILVRFEEHPGSTRSAIASSSRPIMQLRIMELLTPVVQVGEIESIARPEPGKLHSVLKNGQYVPWTYAPHGIVRGSFCRAIELSKSSKGL